MPAKKKNRRRQHLSSSINEGPPTHANLPNNNRTSSPVESNPGTTTLSHHDERQTLTIDNDTPQSLLLTSSTNSNISGILSEASSIPPIEEHDNEDSDEDLSYADYDELDRLDLTNDDEMYNTPQYTTLDDSMLEGKMKTQSFQKTRFNPFTDGGQYFKRKKGKRVQYVVEVPGYHKHNEKQYRITGRKTSGMQAEQLVDNEIEFANRLRFGINAAICTFLKWNFKSSLFIVLLVAVSFFILFTLAFGGLIALSVIDHPDCITPSIRGYDSEQVFWEVWALSWTTFSTVGYGLISPSTPGSDFEDKTFGEIPSCAFVSIVCSMESFIGVLFASFWSAILFAKLDLFKSDAQVQFSDFMCVRYDEGGEMTVKQYDKDGKDIDYTFSRKLTCPVIAFRLVNLLDSHLAGEIIDARLNAVALIDGDNIDTTTRMLAGHAMFGRAFQSEQEKKKNMLASLQKNVNKTLSMRSTSSHSSASSVESAPARFGKPRRGSSSKEEHSIRSVPALPTTKKMRKMKSLDVMNTIPSMHALQSLDRRPTLTRRGSFTSTSSLTDQNLEETVNVYTTLNEDQADDVPKMVYAKLSITPDEHPFFQRVWRFVHVLDEYSPLLTQEVRSRIRGGQWPKELSNEEAIKESVQFDQIAVSFSGLANVTADEVFEQRIYEKEDMQIGYQFCSMLARDANGALTVRLEDLDKIRKQDKIV